MRNSIHPLNLVLRFQPVPFLAHTEAETKTSISTWPASTREGQQPRIESILQTEFLMRLPVCCTVITRVTLCNEHLRISQRRCCSNHARHHGAMAGGWASSPHGHKTVSPDAHGTPSQRAPYPARMLMVMVMDMAMMVLVMAMVLVVVVVMVVIMVTQRQW